MTRHASLGAFALLGGIVFGVSAQQPKLYIQASDLSERPVPGVQFSIKDVNSSVSGRTDVAGKTEILLAANVKPGTSVELNLIGPKYRLFSPWNRRVFVPFESSAAVQVWLYEEGTKFQLGTLVITTLKERIAGSTVSPVISTTNDPKKQRMAMLARIAQESHLSVEQLERAINIASSTDPYQVGLKALYDGQYSEAVAQLSKALQGAIADRASPEKVVNAGLFLGHAQFLAGDYRQAAEAYRQAAAIAGDDPSLLNGIAMALAHTTDLSGAETQLRRVVEIKKRQNQPDSEDLAIACSNLGYVLQEVQKCAEAEPYLLEALAIWKKTLLDGDERLATANGNVGEAKFCRGDYAGAADYFQQELTIRERVLGPTPPLAEKLYQYARKMYAAKQYGLAEPAFLRALAIWEQKSPNRGDIIWTLRYLGSVRLQAKDSAGAEKDYLRALAEQAEASGPDSPPQVGILEDLLSVYEANRDTANMERCYLRILQIWKKVPPSELSNRNIAIVTSNLAILVFNEGDYTRAKPLLEEALPLAERALPPGHRRVGELRKALDYIDKMSTADRMKPA